MDAPGHARSALGDVKRGARAPIARPSDAQVKRLPAEGTDFILSRKPERQDMVEEMAAARHFRAGGIELLGRDQASVHRHTAHAAKFLVEATMGDPRRIAAGFLVDATMGRGRVAL